jgi:ADP-dependent NAD(P)H-hydrate dehydratase / NAD(P)H-hydrate epimerase
MAEELTVGTVRQLIPERPRDAHKGTFGHAFIVGGSQGLTGAVKLAALAAARSGVGLTTIGAPEPLIPAYAVSLMEIMTTRLPATPGNGLSEEAFAPALAFAERCDAVALGPGLGREDAALRFARAFIRHCPLPVVIDADGLYALNEDCQPLLDAPAARIVTPHPGEMAGLAGRSTTEVQERRDEIAAEFAARHGCVTVLKGRDTIVASPEGGVYRNPTGNDGMATGGTGDVLVGLIAGLLAQGLPTLDAALVGVFLHGTAGDLAAAAKTRRAMIAGDLLEALPDAWRSVAGEEHA